MIKTLLSLPFRVVLSSPLARQRSIPITAAAAAAVYRFLLLRNSFANASIFRSQKAPVSSHHLLVKPPGNLERAQRVYIYFTTYIVCVDVVYVVICARLNSSRETTAENRGRPMGVVFCLFFIVIVVHLLLLSIHISVYSPFPFYSVILVSHVLSRLIRRRRDLGSFLSYHCALLLLDSLRLFGDRSNERWLTGRRQLALVLQGHGTMPDFLDRFGLL